MIAIAFPTKWCPLCKRASGRPTLVMCTPTPDLKTRATERSHRMHVLSMSHAGIAALAAVHVASELFGTVRNCIDTTCGWYGDRDEVELVPRLSTSSMVPVDACACMSERIICMIMIRHCIHDEQADSHSFTHVHVHGCTLADRFSISTGTVTGEGTQYFRVV
jgi:hypothetical protein